MSMPETPQRILVIDDHPLFRRGVAQLLALDPGFRMVGEAGSGDEGLELALALRPDLTLLDLNMQGTGGLDTLRRLKNSDPDLRVIVLTVSNNPSDVVAALRAGADGYLLKDMEPEYLLEQLRLAAAGHLALSSSLTEMLAHALRGEDQTPDPQQAGLTEREWEVARLIAAGMSNKLIARELAITEGTVKVHVKNLLKKLNLRSRVEAAVWMVTRVEAEP